MPQVNYFGSFFGGLQKVVSQALNCELSPGKDHRYLWFILCSSTACRLKFGSKCSQEYALAYGFNVAPKHPGRKNMMGWCPPDILMLE